MKALDSILSNLNPEQLQAVKNIEGPVMVLAGPGTGKTQILASRIAYILSQQDLHPSQILCLTYTDAGTIAMRQRLLSFIGPTAYQVNIHTFHSFCSLVISENEGMLGYEGLEPISEIENIELMKKLIDRLKKGNPLKRLSGDPYYEVNRLGRLYQLIKKENWDVGQMVKLTEKAKHDLKDDPDFYYKRNTKTNKKGDLNEKLFHKAVYDLDVLIAALESFNDYQALLIKSRRFDFNDMIGWVIQLFENEKGVLAQYQEQFAYFLVDEYQDTSGSQNRIIELLVDYWDEPNLFVVGDDDQSIYAFQGANIDNILNLFDQYSPAMKLILLTANYRSSQSILNVAFNSIGHNTERLTNKIDSLSKQIISAGENLNFKSEITFSSYEDQLSEVIGISSKIKSLIKAGTAPKEIAILYRKHAQAELITQVLKQDEIPYLVKKRENALENKIIQNILVVMRYLYAEHTKAFSAEHYLFELLHLLTEQVSSLTLAVINQTCKNSDLPWRQTLQLPETFDSINPNEKREIQRAVTDLEYWLDHYALWTIAELVEKVIAKGGFFKQSLIGPQPSSDHVRSFFDFVKEENKRKPFSDLGQLIETIDLYINNKIPLPVNFLMGETNGVQLLTVHGAKGLEFERVFMTTCTYNAWDKSVGRLPFSSLKRIIATPNGVDFSEEETRRLFYVGLTRAKKGLYLSSPQKDEVKNKEIKQSQFIAEVLDSNEIQKRTPEIPPHQIERYEHLLFLPKDEPIPSFINDELVDTLLKDYTLSVTHLNNYLRCPTSFYFNNLLRVPSAKSESAGFGNAIHYALDHFYTQKKEPERNTLNALLEYFVKGLNLQSDCFTKDSYQRRKTLGTNVLTNYFNEYKNEILGKEKFETETSIHQTYVKDIPIKGVIDRVDDLGHSVHVVDYKTGNFEYAKAKINPPKAPEKTDNEEQLRGGDYWRQIVFYHILLKNAKKHLHVTSGEIDFIEPDKIGKFHKANIDVSEHDVNFVTNQIKESYQKIMQKEFEKGCLKKDCEWCNFVKYYYS